MTGGTGETTVIRLSSVAYTYRGPPPVQALKPMNLVVRRGEHVAITGPSGSGKSTLLNLVGLLDRPTEGTIEVDGLAVGAAPERGGERDAGADLRGHPTAPAVQRGAGGAGPGRPGPPGRCPAHRAVRRR